MSAAHTFAAPPGPLAVADTPSTSPSLALYAYASGTATTPLPISPARLSSTEQQAFSPFNTLDLRVLYKISHLNCTSSVKLTTGRGCGCSCRNNSSYISLVSSYAEAPPVLLSVWKCCVWISDTLQQRFGRKAELVYERHKILCVAFLIGYSILFSC